MQIYAGKCKCKKDLDMRITEVRENENNLKSDIIAWIIFGICKRCEKIYFQGLFSQEEMPIVGVDFIIYYNKVIEK